MAEVPNQDPPGTYGPIRGQITPGATATSPLIPPHNIIQTPYAARALYTIYRNQHLGRIALYSAIEGLIQGNPPYDPMELEQQGLGHIANFNNGDASALYEQGGLAYWNLLNQAETIAKFVFYDESVPELVSYAATMARVWSQVVRTWENFETEVCSLTSQILKFGVSPAVWSDEKDWKWRTVEMSRFFVPDQSSSNTQLLSTVFVESVFTVEQLFQIYKKLESLTPQQAKKAPWNKDELGRWLVNRANQWQKWNDPILTVMDIQKRIDNNDISFDVIFTDEVRLVHMLQTEYDGKITHAIFDKILSYTNQTDGTQNFLFFVDRQYDSLKDVLVIFTASPGVFTIHANRGLGQKILPICQATNQLDCDVVNMSRMASTPIVKSSAVSTRDFEAIVFRPGVPTNIGNAEFIQNQLGANIEQLTYAGSYLLNKLNTNIAHSGDDPGGPDRSQGSISPSQARIQSFKEFGVLKNNIAHFYKSFDLVIQNMCYRMMQSKTGYPSHAQSVEWKDRCIALGVPEQLFELTKDGKPKHFYVRATRVAGDGSNLADIMGLESLAPFVGGFTQKGQRQFQKDLVIALRGPDYVAAYLGDSEPDESAGGASLAGVENAVMQNGMSPIFSPDNEQRSHISVHFELGKHLVDLRTQNQMDPVAADKIFSVLIPHLGEHLQAASQNFMLKSFVEEHKKPWKQLQDYATLNRKNAEEQIRAQLEKQQQLDEKQQAAMSDVQRKDAVAKADIARKDFDTEAKNKRADEANQTRGEIMKEATQTKAQNEALKISLDAQNKSRQTEADLRSELATMTGDTISPSDFEKPNA